MPGQYRYSIDQLPYALEELVKTGVGSVMFFGIPDHKDACGSGAYDENGIVQKAFRGAKKQLPDLYRVDASETLVEKLKQTYGEANVILLDKKGNGEKS